LKSKRPRRYNEDIVRFGLEDYDLAAGKVTLERSNLKKRYESRPDLKTYGLSTLNASDIHNSINIVGQGRRF
jgi:hypothetical protein